ncbi:MAG: hypothetical protein ACK4MF_01920, partial [Hyphomicrobiaceae bacterium]
MKVRSDARPDADARDRNTKGTSNSDAHSGDEPRDQLELIARIEAIVREETAALGQHEMSVLGRSIERKAQALMELSRAVAASKTVHTSAEARAGLVALRRALAANERALMVQMRALDDIVEILTAAMIDADSDGTYLPHTGFRRKGR